MEVRVVKKIGAGSCFRLFGGMFLVIGLIIGLIVSLAGKPILPKGIPFAETVGTGLLAGVVFGVIYGLAGGIIYTIMALIYNAFASIVGGIKIILEE